MNESTAVLLSAVIISGTWARPVVAETRLESVVGDESVMLVGETGVAASPAYPGGPKCIPDNLL